MGHWARIDENNIVQEVIVITEEMLDTGGWGDKSQWIKTSYNTRDGKHYVPKDHQDWSEESADQSKALRYRFAGVGDYYDSVRDVFYPQRTAASWTFDETLMLWVAPIPMPAVEELGEGETYYWDEDAYQADTGDPKTQGWAVQSPQKFDE
tara:strand:+ start:1679 stop:2131 length:453 start_codon:yes stop_codon:yes gene_type:complete